MSLQLYKSRPFFQIYTLHFDRELRSPQDANLPCVGDARWTDDTVFWVFGSDFFVFGSLEAT